MSRKPKKETFTYKVMLELDKMEVGESIDKKELVNRLWGINNYDWYVVRSCDVAICAAKKMLLGKKFKGRNGVIERIE
jgi:hypothetical protein